MSTARKERESGPTQPGRNSLGIRGETFADVIDEIRRGFSYTSLVRFQQVSELPLETIAEAIQVPRRTLARRKAMRKRKPDESERLLRVAHVFERAVDLFEGDVAGAPLDAGAGPCARRFNAAARRADRGRSSRG